MDNRILLEINENDNHFNYYIFKKFYKFLTSAPADFILSLKDVNKIIIELHQLIFDLNEEIEEYANEFMLAKTLSTPSKENIEYKMPNTVTHIESGAFGYVKFLANNTLSKKGLTVL